MMENTAEIADSRGIKPSLREHAAYLYDIAFGEKLASAILDASDRIQLLSKNIQLFLVLG